MKSIKVSDSDHKQLKQIALDKECSIIKVISEFVVGYNNSKLFSVKPYEYDNLKAHNIAGDNHG